MGHIIINSNSTELTYSYGLCVRYNVDHALEQFDTVISKSEINARLQKTIL